MNIDDAAKCMEKLGNRTRLEIVRLLVRVGDEGLPVGAIQDHLNIPASTLSHHIMQLASAGLVIQKREGRILRCRPDFERLQDVLSVLTEECCIGVPVTKTLDKAAKRRQKASRS